MELEYQILIDPSFQGPQKDAVAFETGLTFDQITSREFCAYEHHGPEFDPSAPGALTRFYEDLILGRPLPLVFMIQGVKDIDTVMAATLFAKRELAIHPGAPGMVSCVDLVHRYGLTVLGHTESDLGRFLRLLRGYFPSQLHKKEAGIRLVTAIGWIWEYLQNDTLPHLGTRWPSVRVLDCGTNGFVVAETGGSLLEGWVSLYRQGFLRGVLIGPMDAESHRRKVVISKKSLYIPLDLTKAASILNGLERAMGELPEWRVEAGLWLHGPEDGTLILVQHLLDVLIRV